MKKAEQVRLEITQRPDGLWYGRAIGMTDGSENELDCLLGTPYEAAICLLEQIRENYQLT